MGCLWRRVREDKYAAMQTQITKGSKSKTKQRKVKSRLIETPWLWTHCYLTFQTLLFTRFSDSFPLNLPYAQPLFLNNGQVCGLWESPLLDFDDEGDSTDHDGDNLVRRKLLFIDFVESCLKHCEKKKLLELDSFRLRMRYDSELIGATRIDKWFSFVVDRCVKDLPSLKTMSLNAVLFDCQMNWDKSLWMGCPSIEHLSLVSCSFSSLVWHITVKNSSLKFLQVMYCKCKSFQVEAENLESFIFTSEFSQLEYVGMLSECVKLKYISVYAQHAKIIFEMPGTCRDNVKATIDIPNLQVFSYDGYLLPNDVISLKARNPLAACIMLNWDDEEEVLEPTFLPPWTHFPTWRYFLQNFDCCNKVQLDIRHDAIAEAITFPENFRQTFSPPLPNVKYLRVLIVRLRCPQTVARVSALTDSLRWMAPYALFTLTSWDYGEAESSGEDE
ncbi:putative FBD-associated F-box protein [Rosa sericea]